MNYRPKSKMPSPDLAFIWNLWEQKEKKFTEVPLSLLDSIIKKYEEWKRLSMVEASTNTEEPYPDIKVLKEVPLISFEKSDVSTWKSQPNLSSMLSRSSNQTLMSKVGDHPLKTWQVLET